MRLFGTIEKVEERDDGTVVVSGIASTEAVDSEGEVVLASAMRGALPDYWRLGPALREMHDSTKAAGTALAVEVGQDGKTYLEAHVVDPVAVAKVKAKVYRGFSIGGRVPPGGRDPSDPKIIRALDLTEISLVDRPANPEARIELWKVDDPSREADVATDAPRAPDAVEEPAHRCPACGNGLACPKCTGVDASHVGKVAGHLAAMVEKVERVQGERDGALRKLAAVEGQRDALAKRLADTERELAKRPKGALKAVPVSKSQDTGLPSVEPDEPATALDAIRAAHRRPRAT